MPLPLRKSDLNDVDFVDAYELASDGLVTTPASIYLTTTGVSTTALTQTVVSTLPADGEGLQTSADHPVQIGDFLFITGTSPGGAADGEYMVATVVNDTTITVVQTIADSTGGTLNWVYPQGAGLVGFNPTEQAITAADTVEQTLTDVSNHELLDNEPVGTGVNYLPTRTGNKVTQETWTNTATTKTIKTIAYTYTGNKVHQEVRTVFATDGITIVAQATITYSYSGSTVTGDTTVRNV